MTDYIVTIVALVIVITVHECSHALAAFLLGDPTAKMAKRLSLNPLRHLDPLGTVMMFLIHIGWGKPVPVNSRFFKRPRRDEALTALAGPVSNLLMALLLALPVKYLSLFMPGGLTYFFNILIDVALWLFAFNMLPFPPLDGSKFIQMIVPKRFHDLYDRYLNGGAMYFMLFLLFDQFFIARIFGVSLLSQFLAFILVSLSQ